MIFDFTAPAKKQTTKLPENIKKKFHKQLSPLIINFSYPSLHIKKIRGTDRWEARIDYHYRFSFQLEEDIITITAVGIHDEGLGKK